MVLVGVCIQVSSPNFQLFMPSMSLEDVLWRIQQRILESCKAEPKNMHSAFLQLLILSTSLVRAKPQAEAPQSVSKTPSNAFSTKIQISRNNISSPTTFSAMPLFQVVTQTSSTGAEQTATSSPTETSLFHTVAPFATSTAYPATSAAVRSRSVAMASKKSVAGHFRVSLGAVAVLGLVVGLGTGI